MFAKNVIQKILCFRWLLRYTVTKFSRIWPTRRRTTL